MTDKILVMPNAKAAFFKPIMLETETSTSGVTASSRMEIRSRATSVHSEQRSRIVEAVMQLSGPLNLEMPPQLELERTEREDRNSQQWKIPSIQAVGAMQWAK